MVVMKVKMADRDARAGGVPALARMLKVQGCPGRFRDSSTPVGGAFRGQAITVIDD